MYLKQHTNNNKQATSFTLAHDMLQSPKFLAGECICKSCKSTNLDYYEYFDDAKCQDCRQWQNEDPLPL